MRLSSCAFLYIKEKNNLKKLFFKYIFLEKIKIYILKFCTFVTLIVHANEPCFI